MRKSLWILIFSLIWGTSASLAQQCPDYVSDTLANVATECTDVARNQLCYGNITLTIKSYVNNLVFEMPGDIVDVADIVALTLSQGDNNEWGVALMSLQANLPDTIPGQNVIVLLFGDVRVEASDENMKSFYFSGGVGQPNCDEAPDGILLQSPIGETSILTINKATLEFGSTIFLQFADDSMSISTLSGIATVESAGSQQIVPQGTVSRVGLDKNGLSNAAPTYPEPLPAETLLPVVNAVNASSIILPTYDDAAANPRIQALVTAGLIAPLDADNPIIALDAEAIPAAIEALQTDTSLIPVTSGRWRMVDQQHEVTGECIDPIRGEGVGGGSAGGSADEFLYAICGAGDRGTLLYQNKELASLGTNIYGDERTSTQANLGTGEGEVTVTYRAEYHVISPTHIEYYYTASELDGCTSTSIFVYELAEEDDAACSASTYEWVPPSDIASGTYISDDLYVGGCNSDQFAVAMQQVSIEAAEDSLVISAGGTNYTLDYYGTAADLADGSMNISISAVEGSTLYIDYFKGSCIAYGEYHPAD